MRISPEHVKLYETDKTKLSRNIRDAITASARYDEIEGKTVYDLYLGEQYLEMREKQLREKIDELWQ